jgi:geranylgeranyl diphosphate synthase type I
MPELDRLWAYRQPIEAELERFLERAPQELAISLSADVDEAFGKLKEYCLRPAKRIRGSLAAVAYDTAAGTEHAEQAIKLGAALELLHAYLLIIDDVMDRSALRRGLATVHEAYIASGAVGDDRHEAEMLAIDIGLLAQHLANILLLAIDVPPEALRDALKLLHTDITITGIGQFEDLRHRVDREVSEAAVLQKYRYKTSYYTFVNPLQLGFTLAGNSDQALLAVLQSYGEAAGVAFQIRDDHLSIWGDISKHGKSNLDDIHEGKITLLLAYALRNGEHVKELQTVMGNPEAGEAELTRVREMYETSGARAHADELMKTMVTDSKTALKKSTLGDEKLSKLLAELVDYATTRES